jgi:hypothetical protein
MKGATALRGTNTRLEALIGQIATEKCFWINKSSKKDDISWCTEDTGCDVPSPIGHDAHKNIPLHYLFANAMSSYNGLEKDALQFSYVNKDSKRMSQLSESK